MVHHYGGQVYLDGANMNAQVRLPLTLTMTLTMLLSWMGLFRLQLDFRIHISLRKQNKNGFEMHF